MATKVRSKVEKRDTGLLRRFQAALRAAGHGGAYVRVGFLGGGSREDGPTNAGIAAVHEYGYPEGGIPERPFMGPSFDANATKYEKLLEIQARSYLDGRASLETALGLIGLQVVSDIRNYVVGGAPIPPPNSPEVAARKAAKGDTGGGPVRTLVDTGQMLRALVSVVDVGERPKEG